MKFGTKACIEIVYDDGNGAANWRVIRPLRVPSATATTLACLAADSDDVEVETFQLALIRRARVAFTAE